MFLESELDLAGIEAFGADHVAIATGAQWTNYRYSTLEIPVGRLEGDHVYTPDDVFADRVEGDRVLVFDFDHYYLGGLIAEHLSAEGSEVIYATPSGHASPWTFMTNELPYVYQALAKNKVEILTTQTLEAFDGRQATLANLFHRDSMERSVDAVVMVGHREPNDALFHALLDQQTQTTSLTSSIHLIGDALAPGAIAHAIHSGHGFARALVCEDEGLYLRDEPMNSVTPEVVFARG